MKENITTNLEYLSNLCLANGGNHEAYSDRDLFNATEIFQHVLLDVLYTENYPHTNKEKMLELAETTGLAIRELILSCTDKDMREIAKNLIDNDPTQA